MSKEVKVAIITGIFGILTGCVTLGVPIVEWILNPSPSTIPTSSDLSGGIDPQMEVPTTTSSTPFISTPIPAPSTPIPVSPTPIPPLDPSFLFIDDFNEGLKPDWQVDSGEWRMVNGRLVSVGYGDNNYALIFVGNPEWQNYAISLETGSFNYTENAIAVLVRVQDNKNFIWFLVKSSEVVCGFDRDGDDTEIGKKESLDKLFRPIAEGDHHLLIEVQGATYALSMDSQQICSFDDNTFLNGKVGLLAVPGQSSDENPWVDDFKVQLLP